MFAIIGILTIILIIFCMMAITGAPFVPSRNKEINEAFTELYKLGKKDFIIDLGSGNGKIIAIASKYGAGGLGIELNPFLVAYSNFKLRRYKNAKAVCGNMFSYDYPQETTAVYLFGVERDSRRILRAIQKQADRLHKDIYVISYATRLPGMKPEKSYRAYFLYKIKGAKK